jgi:hypothetical protein
VLYDLRIYRSLGVKGLMRYRTSMCAVSLKNLSPKVGNTERNDVHYVTFLSEHYLGIPCTEVKWTRQERTSVFDCETRHVHIRLQHVQFPPKSCVLFR